MYVWIWCQNRHQRKIKLSLKVQPMPSIYIVLADPGLFTQSCPDLMQVLGLFKISSLNHWRIKSNWHACPKTQSCPELGFSILFSFVHLLNYNLDCFKQKQESHQQFHKNLGSGHGRVKSGPAKAGSDCLIL